MEEKNGISKKLLIFDLIVLILIVGMTFSIYDLTKNHQKKEELAKVENIDSKIFEDVTLEAKAAYVYDLKNNEVLYKKNEFIQFPLASITKLMMAVTAVDLVPKNSKITIKKEFLSEEGDSGLLVSESWNLDDLLDFSLTVSSNDGARSVASVIGAAMLNTDDYSLGRKDFISKMNLMAKRIGLQQTYFTNESGLDGEEISGGYGSAIDVGNLMAYILKYQPQLLDATKYQTLSISSLDKVHKAKNTNMEVSQIPGLIGSKTGYTSMAGGNLVIAFDSSIGRPIIVVVLGSTQEGRFTDVLKLVKASQNYITGLN